MHLATFTVIFRAMNKTSFSCGGVSCGCHAASSPTPAKTLPAIADARFESVFEIPGMDCPSEEQMIRLRLGDELAISALRFDLAARRLTIGHRDDNAAAILARLEPLGFGARLTHSRGLAEGEQLPSGADEGAEAGTLRILLAINAMMFMIEIGTGLWASSAGLIADALDMLADALVYGVALYAVGRSARHKLRAAHLSGLFQLLLAIGAFTEVGRRILLGAEPMSLIMMVMASLALLANVACLLLIRRHRGAGAHMTASYIFSANDVLANLGVIIAGALVAITASPWPDWIIGALIGALVLGGAVRILRLR